MERDPKQTPRIREDTKRCFRWRQSKLDSEDVSDYASLAEDGDEHLFQEQFRSFEKRLWADCHWSWRHAQKLLDLIVQHNDG